MTEAQKSYYQRFGMLPREAYDNIVTERSRVGKRGKRPELTEVKAFVASLRKDQPKG